jgi:MazG family protein
MLHWIYRPTEQGMQENSANGAGAKFERLVGIMARLRAPGGCPWDREQTFASIKKYTLEETYEVLDAIDRQDWGGLREELGDFMLQAIFYAEMAQEQGLFDIGDSLDYINAKLIRRHPHVFAEETARTEADVRKRWEEIKAEERKGKAEKPEALLEAVPRSMPALVEAQQITSRAARVGFDWRNLAEVLEKLDEERDEFARAVEMESQDALEDELGDLLFVLVNIARFVKVDPEQALRRTNAKFRARFAHIERRLAEQGKEVSGVPIEELEALWQEAKA